MRYLLPRDSLALIPRGTGVPFKASFDSSRVVALRRLRPAGYAALATLRWLRCAGFAALAPLRWLRYAGYAALATLRWLRPAGSATLAPLRWLRPVGLTPTGRNGSSAAPTGRKGGNSRPSLPLLFGARNAIMCVYMSNM